MQPNPTNREIGELIALFFSSALSGFAVGGAFARTFLPGDVYALGFARSLLPFALTAVTSARFHARELDHPPLVIPRWLLASLVAALPFSAYFAFMSLELFFGMPRLHSLVSAGLPFLASIAGGICGRAIHIRW